MIEASEIEMEYYLRVCGWRQEGQIYIKPGSSADFPSCIGSFYNLKQATSYQIRKDKKTIRALRERLQIVNDGEI